MAAARAMERTASQQQSGDGLKATEAVRDLRRAVSFRDVLEEGHAAAGLILTIAITTGLTLGLLLPRDQSIPDPYSRASNIIGWTYFGCWWVGWYPQIAQNCLSKSVVGISFDQAIFNFLGFLCYSTFNCALYFDPHVQRAYREAHGGQGSDVRINDLAFSLHCNLMTTLSLLQIIAFEKGSQRVSAICWTLCATAAALAGAYLGAMALGVQACTILSFLYLLSYIKLFTSLIKYIPQVVLNYQRKSTIGWNISNSLSDIAGGVFSIMQQCVDAYALKDWSILTGDVVKFGLGLVSILYCVILAIQHYFLFPRTGRRPSKGLPEAAALVEEEQSALLLTRGDVSV